MLGETLKGWIMYKNIVLAYDGSDSGQKALLDCNELAQWSHATLSLVAVMPSTMGFVAMEGSIYDPTVSTQMRMGAEPQRLIHNYWLTPASRPMVSCWWAIRWKKSQTTPARSVPI